MATNVPGVLPWHTSTQPPEQVQSNVGEGTLKQVVDGLVLSFAQQSDDVEVHPRDIVFSGTFEEVNEYFYSKSWGDRLPIVPPTKDRVEEFLALTDRCPFDMLDVMLPGT